MPKSNPISISTQAFGRIPRRQNSIEALNKEIDMLFTSIGAAPFEPKVLDFVFDLIIVVMVASFSSLSFLCKLCVLKKFIRLSVSPLILAGKVCLYIYKLNVILRKNLTLISAQVDLLCRICFELSYFSSGNKIYFLVFHFFLIFANPRFKLTVLYL